LSEAKNNRAALDIDCLHANIEASTRNKFHNSFVPLSGMEASMKYEIKLTSRFKKEYKQIEKRGLDVKLLDDVVLKLAQGTPLDPAYRDHELTGNYVGYRECHIKPDWLLIYRIDERELILLLSQTGTHSDLFG
jgi:mRNA interferase YafQ